MTALDRLRADLVLRNRSARTVGTYVACVRKVAESCRVAPADLQVDDARAVLVGWRDAGRIADGTLRLYGYALRFFFGTTLGRPEEEPEGGLLRVRCGKGGDGRVVPMSRALWERLSDYLVVVRPPGPWLFAGRAAAAPLGSAAARRVLSIARERAGIVRRLTFHGLRHAYATHQLEDGVDILLVQRALGHRSLATTARYLHLCERRLRFAENPLDRLDP